MKLSPQLCTRSCQEEREEVHWAVDRSGVLLRQGEMKNGKGVREDKSWFKGFHREGRGLEELLFPVHKKLGQTITFKSSFQQKRTCCIKGIFSTMFPIWAACPYMLSVSLTRCKKKNLKNWKKHFKANV